MGEWTDSEIATLKQLWDHESASTIAAKLGRSKNSVCGKIYKLKLPQKRPENARWKDGLRIAPLPEEKRKKYVRKPKKKASIKQMKVRPKFLVMTRRGKCQWIEGDPVRLRTTDEGKCLKPTIYKENGNRSPYCFKHTEMARSGRVLKYKDL